MCPFYDTSNLRYSFQKYGNRDEERRKIMKGYTVESGYMGFLDGRYYLFADESDYRETFLEQEEE
jgi:hypothetical protein